MDIYNPSAMEEVISFRRCHAIDNIYHGREGYHGLDQFKGKGIFLLSPFKEADVVMELSARTILLSKRLGEEVGKGVSPAWVVKLRKELTNLGHYLLVTLNVNTSLGSQGDFDVWKDFCKGEFMPVEDILDEEGVEVPMLGGCDECGTDQAI
ncbi:hypothetical protein VNO80_16174 [Phaseolus coccineus]|uniref:Uncharacterized protein n=1 Tax=Phaseolus coccineus TaxID=3886 RepID=A0AAN9MLN2_PHACN